MKSKKEVSKKGGFSRTDTKIIKGVAILFMLLHHLWAFPDRIAGGELNTAFGLNYIEFFGILGKICVSIFFFLGGYGIYMQSKKRGFSIISSIKKLYSSYWKVFLIFVPIAFLFFRHQPEYCADAGVYARYDAFNIKAIVSDFFGGSSTLNGEWWFLGSYLIAIASFPLAKKIFSKLDNYKAVLLVIAINIFMAYIAPAIGQNLDLGRPINGFIYKNFLCQPGEFYSCFFMGMLFAKNDWMVKLRAKLAQNFKINFFTSALALVLLILLRQVVTGASLDIIQIPLFIILSLEVIYRIPFLPKILGSFGKHSTTMWLTHSFCCYYFYPLAFIVTWTHWATPSFITLVLMSYLISLGFDYGWVGLDKFVSKFQKRAK